MSYLNQNIKELRKQKGYTQDILAQKLGIKRSLIGAYEEQRAEPKIATIQKLSYLFNITIDELINSDLNIESTYQGIDILGKTLRVLPITVDHNDRERIILVPEKAEAGYAHSYSDPEYIEELPNFSLPVNELYQENSYRMFQISGDSMLPLQSGSYIIGSYLDNWTTLKDGECYIVVTRDEGIVYKRVWKQFDQAQLLLKSDNPIYEPYQLPAKDIVEIWSAQGYMSFDLPDPEEQQISDKQLSSNISTIKDDVGLIKKILEAQKKKK